MQVIEQCDHRVDSELVLQENESGEQNLEMTSIEYLEQLLKKLVQRYADLFCTGGHYVVICGYDAAKDEFEIRDPASSRKHERITSKCLEEARKSFGTDEDLLLVSLAKRNF
ncbi:hypothetical protein AgCh_035421 [Apium graveolens]